MITQKPLSGPQLFLQRMLAAAVFGIVILAVITAPAEAAARRAYAGIVVDAKSGKTLYSHAADEQRYPASVTKVMTLYVLFQELEAGRLSLSSKLKVSKHAAAAVPTKLGLKAGSTIRVEDAIKSLVTLSANDISRVIAENISGTESEFAVRMTKTARALGMNNTTYKNASGLPDSGQVTTVRDQARLGIAVYQHFPKYYEYFQTRSFKYGGRTYGNHNRLLGQSGIDGIKTGYIRASGYNLLTAARKNNRHIVVVAFGFDSGGSRNSKVASLVNSYMPKARKGSYVAQAQIQKPGAGGTIRVAAVPVTPMPRPLSRMPAPQPAAPLPQVVAAIAVEDSPTPEPRPVELVPDTALEATTQLASFDPQAPVPQPKPIDIIGSWISETIRYEPQASNGEGVPLPPVGIGESAPARPAETIDLLTSGATGDAAEISAWVIQIGASHDQALAQSLLDDARGKVGSLSDYRSFIEPTQKNGKTFYRARFSGFGDGEQARNACETLIRNKMSCLAMQS